VIAYRAMLDVPRALVVEVARLLAARRRELGTRRNSRALSCHRQAVLVLVWLRTRADLAVLGAGFGISRATAYRYRDETVQVLAGQAPELHDALAQVAAQGWAHVIIDGKLFRTDRVATTTTSRDGHTINSWYSGRHHAPGGNIQAVMRPDGLPIWTSEVLPGRCHDLTAARAHGLPGALHHAACARGLPTLADNAYDTAGHGVLTPIKQPRNGRALDPTQQTFNALHRATRALGERGFALLTGTWRCLQRITVSPSKIGTLVRACLVLTLIENRQLHRTR
jgi:hypothetical protein